GPATYPGQVRVPYPVPALIGALSRSRRPPRQRHPIASSGGVAAAATRSLGRGRAVYFPATPKRRARPVIAPRPPSRPSPPGAPRPHPAALPRDARRGGAPYLGAGGPAPGPGAGGPGHGGARGRGHPRARAVHRAPGDFGRAPRAAKAGVPRSPPVIAPPAGR